MPNKKIILWVSGLVTVLLLILNWIGTFKICGATEYGQCMDVAYSAIVNLIPVIVVFVFSLTTYWMRDEVYRAWFRFARWWIPLSMLLILISPEYTSDWLYPIVKGTVAFLTSIIFVAVSLLIILIKYLRLRP